MDSFAIISNGNKQKYLYDYLIFHNYSAKLVTNFNLTEYKYIVASIPFSKDGENVNCDFYTSFPITTFISLLKPGQILFGGGFKGSVVSHCMNSGIKAIDILNIPDFYRNNAFYTAEGLLGYIISNTNFSLKASNILVLGYGKCGSEICNLFNNVGSNIFFYENNESKINDGLNKNFTFLDINKKNNNLSKIDIIINCIPKNILSISNLKTLQKSCTIFDIASSPYGFDKDILNSLSLTYHICPGLPGKYASKSSGKLIAKNISSIIEGTAENESQFR